MFHSVAPTTESAVFLSHINKFTLFLTNMGSWCSNTIGIPSALSSMGQKNLYNFDPVLTKFKYLPDQCSHVLQHLKESSLSVLLFELAFQVAYYM